MDEGLKIMIARRKMKVLMLNGVAYDNYQKKREFKQQHAYSVFRDLRMETGKEQ